MKVILLGCGIMGRRIAEALSAKASIAVVGAVDTDAELVGKDLGELFASPQETGITIRADAEVLLTDSEVQAVILTTSSHLVTVLPQIIECVKAGKNIISTCEELSYPWQRNPVLAQEIDLLAKKMNITVVGTGINPGYLMDSLPLTLTAPCLRVDALTVTRMMNSARRRIPFQKKVGTGMTQDEFRKNIDDKVITGHVGLLESINMIAAGLGWKLDEAVELPPQPVIADKATETGMGTVNPGDVIGLISVAFAKREGNQVITLEFHAHAGVTEEYDEVIIAGEPPIHEKIIGGIHGDIGTVAVTINTIPKTVEAAAGLKVMNELPSPCAVL